MYPERINKAAMDCLLCCRADRGVRFCEKQTRQANDRKDLRKFKKKCPGLGRGTIYTGVFLYLVDQQLVIIEQMLQHVIRRGGR